MQYRHSSDLNFSGINLLYVYNIDSSKLFLIKS